MQVLGPFGQLEDGSKDSTQRAGRPKVIEDQPKVINAALVDYRGECLLRGAALLGQKVRGEDLLLSLGGPHGFLHQVF